MRRLWLNSSGLSLVFNREIDRWSHRVAAGADAGTIFLSSREGDANEDCPPSPPLQAVDRHELGANRLAVLGVGKSGLSHWSASFESGAGENSKPAASLETGESHDRGIRIELACLSGENSRQPVQPTSRYTLGDQIQGVLTKNGAIRLLSSGPAAEFDVILTALSGGDWGTELQLKGNELIIRPTRMSSEPRKATRWGYCLTLDG